MRYLLCLSFAAVLVFAILFHSSKIVDNFRFWQSEDSKNVQRTAPWTAIPKHDSSVISSYQPTPNMSLEYAGLKNIGEVVLAVTLCGHDPKQEQQILVMLKSAVIMSPGMHFNVLIVADSEDSYVKITEEIESWPQSSYSSLSLSYISLWYPKGKEWMKTFRTLCTTERLYYPIALNSYDAIIHVDTDVIFLRPVEELWNFFLLMNSQQLIAMAPEHEDPENAYYNSAVNKVPHYGKLGLNAGVMLMNLTRMRTARIDWLPTVHSIYESYRNAPLHFADQDILNVFFHHYPDYLLELPCNWNYRSDFCRFRGNTCSVASGKDGVALLHGNRGVFLSNDEPAFNSIYNGFLKYNWSSDLAQSFVDPLEQELSRTKNTFCGSDSFIASYTKYLRQHSVY